MAMDMIFLSALLAIVFVPLLTLRDSRRYNSKGHLPPGPTPLPILGNVLDVPRSSFGLAFSALNKKYGGSNAAFTIAAEVLNILHRCCHLSESSRPTDGCDRVHHGRF